MGAHNISGAPLSLDTLALLNLGLRFRPTPAALTLLELDSGFNKFVRRVRLRCQFGDTPVPAFWVPNPIWQPHRAPQPVEAYLQRTGAQLRTRLQALLAAAAPAAGTRPAAPANLGHAAATALRQLQRRTDLIIKPADKNLGLTVMAAAAYRAAQLSHLTDANTYTEVQDLPAFVERASATLRVLLRTHADALGADTVKYLAQSLSLTHPPNFYLLPKLHKMADPHGPIKGRPIAACHSWLTTHASKWLSIQLNQLLPLYPTILPDRWQLLRELDTLRVPAAAWLVTFDVESLYPNVPHDPCVAACATALNKGRPGPDSRAHRAAVIALLRFVLTHSVATAQGRHYHQVSGGAMGTNCMPPAAQLYLAVRWEEALKTELGAAFPTHYWRYIDDGLVLFTGTEQELLAFLARLNTHLPTIKITYTYSQSHVEFLDLVISKRMEDTWCTPGGSATVGLRVRTHQKPLNRYLYMPFTSHHPPAAFLSFINAELIRYAATCSDECWYDSMVAAFTHRLLRRGYPRALIERAQRAVRWADRRTYILHACAPKPSKNKLVLALPYASGVPELAPQRVLHAAHTRAAAARPPTNPHAPTFTGALPERPIVAFSRTPNLGACLVKARH